jgi:hypothetical protein
MEYGSEHSDQNPAESHTQIGLVNIQFKFSKASSEVALKKDNILYFKIRQIECMFFFFTTAWEFKSTIFGIILGKKHS